MTCTATMMIVAQKDAEYWLEQAGNFRQERDDAKAEINRLRADFEKIIDEFNVNHSSKWCRAIALRALNN